MPRPVRGRLPCFASTTDAVANRSDAERREAHVVLLVQAAHRDRADDLPAMHHGHATAPPDVTRIAVVGDVEAALRMARVAADLERRLPLARGREGLVHGDLDRRPRRT